MQYIKNKISNFYLLITLSIFFLDRSTKIYIIKKTEEIGTSEIFFSNYLNIQLVWNEGIAFGLLSFNESFFYNIITFFISIVIIILIYFSSKSKSFEKIAYVLIIGGALGNLFDRVYYNAVPDFIDLNYQGYHWFIFNVADIFITVGIICLIFAELLNYKSNDEKK